MTHTEEKIKIQFKNSIHNNLSLYINKEVLYECVKF